MLHSAVLAARRIGVFPMDSPLLDMMLYISLFCLLVAVKLPMRLQINGGKIAHMSYGIYLSHFMLISAFLKFGLFQKLPLCIEPLVMAITVLVATMVMLWILGKLGLKIIIM